MILNDLYDPISDTSGEVEIILDDSFFIGLEHIINIEAWDILNNHSVLSQLVHTNTAISDKIFKVYNFPNPVKDNTFFTFQMKNPEPIDINITIYSKRGRKIKSFYNSINESLSYHVIPSLGWNGTSDNNTPLKNGTYFYHLLITSHNGETIHDDIHNLTILK